MTLISFKIEASDQYFSTLGIRQIASFMTLQNRNDITACCASVSNIFLYIFIPWANGVPELKRVAPELEATFDL